MRVYRRLTILSGITILLGSGLLFAEDKKTPAKTEAQPASKPAEPANKTPQVVPTAAAFAPAQVDEESIAVPSPPFSEGIFPCSDCHEKGDAVNLTPRKLTEEHDKLVFHHGSRDRWCFDCHNPNDRDKLRLASGRLVDFKRSYLLCGQCHGPKLRDWRAGVHGKRTGYWNGKKQYLLCVNCHNPHMPKFKALKPMKRPRKPSEITFKNK